METKIFRCYFLICPRVLYHSPSKYYISSYRNDGVTDRNYVLSIVCQPIVVIALAKVFWSVYGRWRTFEDRSDSWVLLMAFERPRPWRRRLDYCKRW